MEGSQVSFKEAFALRGSLLYAMLPPHQPIAMSLGVIAALAPEAFEILYLLYGDSYRSRW